MPDREELETLLTIATHGCPGSSTAAVGGGQRIIAAVVAAMLAQPVMAAPPGVTVNGGTEGVEFSFDGSAPPNGTITGDISSAVATDISIVSGTLGTLTNSGTINGVPNGINNDGASTINRLDNAAAGTIGGGSNAVGGAVNNAGGIGTLTNSGTISGTNYSINNAGTISTLTNEVGGTISNSGGSSANAAAVINTNSIGTLTNSGAISSVHMGINNISTITVLTITATGVINAGTSGILNAQGASIVTLTNDGTITGDNGIYNSGSSATPGGNGWIGTLTNSGVITGSNTGIKNVGTIGAVINAGTGTIESTGGTAIENSALITTLTNNGTIIGTAGNQGAGINNSPGSDPTVAIVTLTNNGSILGSRVGILSSGSITTLTNNAGHSIVASGGTTFNADGLINRGTIGTLTNSGTIDGTTPGVGFSASGINNSGGSGVGTITTLDNTTTGTISSGGTGINNNNGGVITAVTNAGTITGAVMAIYNDASSAMGVITNTGVIAGTIQNDSAQDLSINGGTTFGTLTGYGGGGVVGTIINTSSNVIFGAGRLLLNSDINVGANTVNNTGAVLQVNEPRTITGNYSQGSGATLQIGVASGAAAQGTIATDTGYGRLVVTGNTTIAANSTIALQPTGYSFAAGQRFVVVDTAGTATYNEGQLRYVLNGGPSNLTVTGTVMANGGNSDLVVNIDPATTPAAWPATAPNAISALSGLLSYTGISNAGLLNLYNATRSALGQGSVPLANQIGKQLGPIFPNWAPAKSTFDAMDVVAERISEVRLARQGGQTGLSTGEGPLETEAWARAFSGHEQQSGRDQVDGYSADYSELLLGADRAVDSRWRVGGALASSNASFDGAGDTAGNTTRVSSYGLIGYASYAQDAWYANFSGAAMQQQYTTRRMVSFPGFSDVASGSFGGQLYVLRAEAGLPMPWGNATLTPVGSLMYSHRNQAGYTESSSGGAALAVTGAQASSLKSGLGARLNQEFPTRFGQVVLSGRVQWIHEISDTSQMMGASFAGDPSSQTAFTTAGATPVSDLAELALGATLLRSDNLSLSLHYNLQAGRDFHAQTGSLRLLLRF
jgi:outer membrane autotransporter protein